MDKQTHGSLKQLREFLQNLSKSQRQDPYWQSILQSDIRNIIPKYEVAKIQLVKTNLSKIRLILQNLNSFISLQIQKKHLKQEMIDLNENVLTQFEEIIQDSKKNQSKNQHYDVNLSARKKQVQSVYKQFTKNRSAAQLISLVGKSKKWKDYIEKNIKVLSKVTEDQIHEDIINFIETYQGLFNVSQMASQRASLYQPHSQTLDQIILKTGSYTKTYENRLKDRILIRKLVEDIYSQKQGSNLSNKSEEETDEGDYWVKEVKRLRKIHNI